MSFILFIRCRRNAMSRKYHPAGFTLIELMIVVAIIGILAAIAIPKFSNLIQKSREGATKGSLGEVRAALRIFYADNEGTYPSDDLSCLTAGGKYLNAIPKADVPSVHAPSNKVCVSLLSVPGGCRLGLGAPALYDGQLGPLWIYWEQDLPPQTGTLRRKGDFWLACTHLDSSGTGWSTY